jgi:hypothetical protein
MKNRQGPRKPREIRVPVMGRTRNNIATVMYTALAALRKSPCLEAYDNLAEIFNTASIALESDHRHREEATHLNDAATALLNVADVVRVGAPLRPEELKTLTIAVNDINRILPALDFNQLRHSEALAELANRAMRRHSAQAVYA